MFRIGTVVVCCSLLAALLLLLTPSALAQEAACTADLEIEQVDTQELGDGTKVAFSVEISTPAACAEIEYDVVVELREPSDQITRVRIPMVTRLRDGELTQRVEHTLEPGYSMLDYEVQFVACGLCDDEPEP